MKLALGNANRKLSRRGRRSKLLALMHETPARYRAMLNLIRAGGFSCDAAVSIGIAPETFSRWLARGAREGRGAFRQFRQDVQRASAQARVLAEIEVRQSDPLAWLRYGPGRTTPGRPGWTELPTAEALSPSPKTAVVPTHRPPDVPDLLATLKVFEQLGFIEILPIGHQALASAAMCPDCD
jgi:hypothetical protein